MTFGRIAVAVAFALSCFGLLLFLWLAFGGASPLKSKSYRFHLQTTEALGLVSQADVRISGVSVGKVISFEREGPLTDVTIEIAPEFAPRPVDTKAVLRQKTLLGETYIELTPGSAEAEMIPEDGMLAADAVDETVRIDQLLKAFGKQTRADIDTWITSLAAGLNGQGANFNAAVASAAPTARAADGVLGVLNRQSDATRRLIADSGVVFGAVGRQDAAVQSLITSGEELLAATAARDAELQETLRILPTFLRELRPTMAELERTTTELDPVVDALAPVAAGLEPTLQDVTAFAPDLEATFEQLRPLARAAKRGLPAADKLLEEARPLMKELYPTARDLIPAVDYLKQNQYELAYSWPKAAATAAPTLPDPVTGNPLNYLRLLPVVGAESLVAYPNRLATSRTNAYSSPRWLEGLATDGLESFSCEHAVNVPLLNVPCKLQAPQTFRGESSSFPHVKRAGR